VGASGTDQEGVLTTVKSEKVCMARANDLSVFALAWIDSPSGSDATEEQFVLAINGVARGMSDGA
jgi:hypothetical protein